MNIIDRLKSETASSGSFVEESINVEYVQDDKICKAHLSNAFLNSYVQIDKSDGSSKKITKEEYVA